MSKNKIQTINNDFISLEHIELSNDLICDFETGLCGPTNDIKENDQKTEETENEHNDLV